MIYGIHLCNKIFDTIVELRLIISFWDLSCFLSFVLLFVYLFCLASNNNLSVFSDVNILILQFNILRERNFGFAQYNSFWIVYLLYLNEKKMATNLHAFKEK